MLQDQIDALKLRGVTAEQMTEIQAQFKRFDKDSSGALDLGELRTCLYSLGNDFGKKDVESIMKQYGKGEGKERVIPYDGFKEFMIKLYGDSDAPEALLQGYDLVTRGTAPGDTSTLDDFLTEDQVKYLRDHAPKVTGAKEGTSGSDYRAWIESSMR